MLWKAGYKSEAVRLVTTERRFGIAARLLDGDQSLLEGGGSSVGSAAVNVAELQQMARLAVKEVMSQEEDGEVGATSSAAAADSAAAAVEKKKLLFGFLRLLPVAEQVAILESQHEREKQGNGGGAGGVGYLWEVVAVLTRSQQHEAAAEQCVAHGEYLLAAEVLALKARTKHKQQQRQQEEEEQEPSERHQQRLELSEADCYIRFVQGVVGYAFPASFGSGEHKEEQEDPRGQSLLSPGEWVTNRVGQRGTILRAGVGSAANSGAAAGTDEGPSSSSWVLRLADGSEIEARSKDLTLLRSKVGVKDLLSKAKALCNANAKARQATSGDDGSGGGGGGDGGVWGDEAEVQEGKVLQLEAQVEGDLSKLSHCLERFASAKCPAAMVRACVPWMASLSTTTLSGVTLWHHPRLSLARALLSDKLVPLATAYARLLCGCPLKSGPRAQRLLRQPEVEDPLVALPLLERVFGVCPCPTGGPNRRELAKANEEVTLWVDAADGFSAQASPPSAPAAVAVVQGGSGGGEGAQQEQQEQQQERTSCLGVASRSSHWSVDAEACHRGLALLLGHATAAFVRADMTTVAATQSPGSSSGGGQEWPCLLSLTEGCRHLRRPRLAAEQKEQHGAMLAALEGPSASTLQAKDGVYLALRQAQQKQQAKATAAGGTASLAPAGAAKAAKSEVRKTLELTPLAQALNEAAPYAPGAAQLLELRNSLAAAGLTSAFDLYEAAADDASAASGASGGGGVLSTCGLKKGPRMKLRNWHKAVMAKLEASEESRAEEESAASAAASPSPQISLDALTQLAGNTLLAFSTTAATQEGHGDADGDDKIDGAGVGGEDDGDWSRVQALVHRLACDIRLSRLVVSAANKAGGDGSGGGDGVARFLNLVPCSSGVVLAALPATTADHLSLAALSSNTFLSRTASSPTIEASVRIYIAYLEKQASVQWSAQLCGSSLPLASAGALLGAFSDLDRLVDSPRGVAAITAKLLDLQSSSSSSSCVNDVLCAMLGDFDRQWLAAADLRKEPLPLEVEQILGLEHRTTTTEALLPVLFSTTAAAEKDLDLCLLAWQGSVLRQALVPERNRSHDFDHKLSLLDLRLDASFRSRLLGRKLAEKQHAKESVAGTLKLLDNLKEKLRAMKLHHQQAGFGYGGEVELELEVQRMEAKHQQQQHEQLLLQASVDTLPSSGVSHATTVWHQWRSAMTLLHGDGVGGARALVEAPCLLVSLLRKVVARAPSSSQLPSSLSAESAHPLADAVEARGNSIACSLPARLFVAQLSASVILAMATLVPTTQQTSSANTEERSVLLPEAWVSLHLVGAPQAAVSESLVSATSTVVSLAILAARGRGSVFACLEDLLLAVRRTTQSRNDDFDDDEDEDAEVYMDDDDDEKDQGGGGGGGGGGKAVSASKEEVVALLRRRLEDAFNGLALVLGPIMRDALASLALISFGSAGKGSGGGGGARALAANAKTSAVTVAAAAAAAAAGASASPALVAAAMAAVCDDNDDDNCGRRRQRSDGECLADFERAMEVVLSLLVNVDLLSDLVVSPPSGKNLTAAALLHKWLLCGTEGWQKLLRAAPSEKAKQMLRQTPIGQGMKAVFSAIKGTVASAAPALTDAFRDSEDCLKCLSAIVSARTSVDASGDGGSSRSAGGIECAGLSLLHSSLSTDDAGGSRGGAGVENWRLVCSDATFAQRARLGGLAAGPLIISLSGEDGSSSGSGGGALRQEGRGEAQRRQLWQVESNGGALVAFADLPRALLAVMNETPAQAFEAVSVAIAAAVNDEEAQEDAQRKAGAGAARTAVAATDQERRAAFSLLFKGASLALQRCVRRWLTRNKFYASSLQATAREFVFTGSAAAASQGGGGADDDGASGGSGKQQRAELSAQLQRSIRPWRVSFLKSGGCALCRVPWPGTYLSYLSLLRSKHAGLLAVVEGAKQEAHASAAGSAAAAAGRKVEEKKGELALFEASELFHLVSQLDATEGRLAHDMDARKSKGGQKHGKSGAGGEGAAAAAVVADDGGGEALLTARARQNAMKKVTKLHQRAKVAYTKVWWRKGPGRAHTQTHSPTLNKTNTYH